MDHIKKWSELLATKLQPQLDELNKSIQTTDLNTQEYIELLHLITALRARPIPNAPLEAKVNNQSVMIKDTSKIFVDIGLDKHIELSLENAEIAVEKRIDFFKKQRQDTLQKIDKLNKDIFVGMSTCRQLQELEEKK
jgi:prefoldin subunit 5